jgi:GNAT superfamily N-acetyltransferase
LQGRARLIAAIALSQRLERAEGSANARFVEARARIIPGLGACWTEIAGAYAMFDGPASPCTQTFGLGLFQTPTADDMNRLEAFFRDRRAPVFHEVSPMADPSLVALLTARGYRPIELTSVMYLPLAERGPATQVGVPVRVVQPHEHDLWARTAAAGWADQAQFPDLTELMQIVASRENAVDFLAELDGQPAAAAVLAIHDGVALLGGASTIPHFRRRGAQQALMDARLDHAARAGCDLAMISAGPPGGGSERNAIRQGFRTAYTRIKWELAR